MRNDLHRFMRFAWSTEICPDSRIHCIFWTGSEDASSQFPPNLPLVLFFSVGTSSFLVGIGIFVKMRNPHRQPGGKFKNPLRKINLIIATVVLFWSLLHTLTYFVELPKDLLFPRVPMGFDMVAMLAFFFFSSPEMKTHAVRRFPFLRRILRAKANSIEPERVERGGAGIAAGNEMQLEIVRPPAGALQ